MNSKVTPCRIFTDTFKHPHLFVDFYHPVSFILGLVPQARTGSPCRRQCSSFRLFAPFKFEQKTVMGSEAFTFLTICPFSLFVFGIFHTSRPRSLLITFALKESHYIIVFFSFHQCTVCVRNVTAIFISVTSKRYEHF